MQTIQSIAALAVFLLGASSSLVAQNKLPDGSQLIMTEMTNRIADIDSSLQVRHYSLAQRRALLKQLYQVDQRYRDSLENGSHSTAKQRFFTHKMVANDQANQVLFRKLVETFGWPTPQEYGEQGPKIAWLIVWHAKPDYQKRYYPLYTTVYNSSQHVAQLQSLYNLLPGSYSSLTSYDAKRQTISGRFAFRFPRWGPNTAPYLINRN